PTRSPPFPTKATQRPTRDQIEFISICCYQLHELRGRAFKRRLACGSIVFTVFLFFVFSLYERKNEKQKKIKYRCERPHQGAPRKSCQLNTASWRMRPPAGPSGTRNRSSAPSCSCSSR